MPDGSWIFLTYSERDAERAQLTGVEASFRISYGWSDSGHLVHLLPIQNLDEHRGL